VLGTLSVWNTASVAAPIARFRAGAAIHSAAWHPDGRKIAAGDVFGRVHLLGLSDRTAGGMCEYEGEQSVTDGFRASKSPRAK
jgi:hypothetical protein